MTHSWGWGAESVHGVPRGFVMPCCGRRARSEDAVLVYADSREMCDSCARQHYEGRGQGVFVL